MNRQLVLDKTKMIELEEKDLKKSSKMDMLKLLRSQIFSFNKSHLRWLGLKTLAYGIVNGEETGYNKEKILHILKLLLIKNINDLKTGAQAPSSLNQDLRDFSRYSSISDFFQRSLRKILIGLGKFNFSSFNHVLRVTRLISSILQRLLALIYSSKFSKLHLFIHSYNNLYVFIKKYKNFLLKIFTFNYLQII